MSMVHAPVEISEIGYGDRAIYRTVSKMKEVIQRSLSSQRVRQKAEEIVSGIVDNDQQGEVRSIYQYVQKNIRYTRDPKGLEYVQTPDYLLDAVEQNKQAFGDCDDKTVLGLSLLKTIGYDVAIKVVSYLQNKKFSHVYGLVKFDGQWVPFDATRPDTSLGWEAPGITRTFESKVGYADSSVSGLGEIRWDDAFQIAAGTTIAYIIINGFVAKFIGQCR